MESGANIWGPSIHESTTGDQLGAGQAQVTEWVTLTGTVVSVDENTLVVETGAAGDTQPTWTEGRGPLPLPSV